MYKWRKQLALSSAMVVLAVFLNRQPCLAQERHGQVQPAPEQLVREHVVPLGVVQQQLEAGSAAAARDRADLERVLSLPEARELLQKSNIRFEQVRTAVAMLSPEELARLAARARLAEQDVQGGILVGVLALIGLVVVILVVIAIVNDEKPSVSY